MNTKTNRILYWTSTGLFSAAMIFSGYSYLTVPEMAGAFSGLGFTEGYFRIELAIAKILGALALILPFVPKWMKNFAYVGFTINLVSAMIAHIVMDYNAYGFVAFSIIALVASYYNFSKLENNTLAVQPEMIK